MSKIYEVPVAVTSSGNVNSGSNAKLAGDLAAGTNIRPSMLPSHGLDRNARTGRCPVPRADRSSVGSTIQAVLLSINRSPSHRKLLGAPGQITSTVQFLADNCRRSLRRLIGKTVFSRNRGRVILIHSVSLFDVYRRRVLPFVNHTRITCVPGRQMINLDGLTHVMRVCSHHLRIRRHLAHRITRTVRRVLRPHKITIIMRTDRVYVIVHNIRGPNS